MRSRVLTSGAVLGLVLLALCPAYAQEASSPVPNLDLDWSPGVSSNSGLKSLMLVDPSRLTVSHSLSMSYGMGSGWREGTSSVAGLFLSHVNYRLADPLHVWMDVGVGFQPTLSMDSEGRAQIVVPGFGLLYQPSDRFRFEVIVQNPNYYYNPYRLWRR